MSGTSRRPSPPPQRRPSRSKSLIQRVEEFERRDYLEMLDRLTRDNLNLQRDVLHYQREWCALLDLLQYVNEALVRLQNALAKCFQEQVDAEEYWLTSWGIEDEITRGAGYNPTGWV
ncbi:hypothetical protein AYO20_04605 [Fonsecaea nubica]|uniref:Uncharacterized protein n=1 Tax=Fonsecaea nubica TaxID=856822 RepID=A0A178D4R7_9EURO|nr:hypothetical protein AYO20_04605 [Fonsecaea nubica]OAL36191.1 hypothetical protein AYO20_04605 [Fonsecaea nubica]